MTHTFIDRKENGLMAFSCSTPQFKTARISAHLILPLVSPAVAAHRAIIPNVVSRAIRAYPDYTEFGKRLQELYGASVHAGVSRIGGRSGSGKYR